MLRTVRVALYGRTAGWVYHAGLLAWLAVKVKAA